MLVMSMTMADELADRLQRRSDAFADYLTTLGPEQWRARCGNHPTIHAGDEDEGRAVGTVAHHVAVALPRQVAFLHAIVNGGETPRPSQAANAEHARANPDPDPAETVSLLRRNSTDVVGVVRALSESELARTAQTFLGELSASQAVERVLIGHLDWHEGSIKATLGHPL
jgi:hypothetical protein